MITLGIIGVVAALTMPTLVANYQKKAQVVQIRKLTNEFVNALDTLITEEGKSSLRTTSIFKSEDALDNWIKSKFNATPCEAANCFAQSKYKSIDKKNEQTFTCNGKAYLLANSTAICVKSRQEEVVTEIYTHRDSSIEEKTATFNHLDVYVDTNGHGKPNTGGRDMFGFTIDEKLQVHYYGYITETTVILYNLKADYNPKTQFSLANVIFPAAYAIGKNPSQIALPTNRPKPCLSEPFGEFCIELLKYKNWVMDY